jgi:DNA-directed RNA polymerase specialized sigma24 family protein
MNSNENKNQNPNTLPLEDGPELDATPSSNDNAAILCIPDTTSLVAHRDVVRYVRGTLRRYGVEAQDMPDAIAEVQTDAIEVARKKRMPADLEQWKALCVTIASRWAIDQLREAEVRDRYDAGLSDEADRYMSPMLHWEQRDPVDTKRYIALLKEMFDSGQMPENGEEILQDAADEVAQEVTAAELGISENTVKLRLFRMRARFHAKLAALGMVTLMTMLLLFTLLAPLGGVGAPAPQTNHAGSGTPAPSAPAPDAGKTGPTEKSTEPVKPNRDLPD